MLFTGRSLLKSREATIVMGKDAGVVDVVETRENAVCSSQERYWVCWTSLVQVRIEFLRRRRVVCNQGRIGNVYGGLCGGLEVQAKVLGV